MQGQLIYKQDMHFTLFAVVIINKKAIYYAKCASYTEGG